MSRNRHSSSLRNFKKTPRRNQIHAANNLVYGSLEDRKLLAVDFTSVTTDLDFGGGATNSIGVGPQHVVAVQNGQLRIFNKSDGSVAVTKSLANFWIDTAGAGAESNTEMVGGISDPSVVYDADTRRWFISSISDADIITGALGTQNPVLLAVSRTSDPTQDWQSTGNIYDVDADGFPDTFFNGGFLPFGGDSAGANLSVDDNNVYVNVDVANPFAPDEIWVFNKFSDLVVPNPTSGGAFVEVSPSRFAEWGTDVTGTALGSFGLNTRTNGASIRLSEFTNPNNLAAIALSPPVNIPVQPFLPPPINVRQLFDPDLRNSGAELTASVVRHGNSLWAVHTILGSAGTSALRWYEINLTTRTIAQWGTIEDPVDNYMFASIAVTAKGHVVIAHTTTGFSAIAGESQFPSASVTVGYDVNGVMTFEAPINIADGDAGYLDNVGNLWSESSIAVDPNPPLNPNDPDKVWVLAPWSAGMGKTQLSELTLLGHSPTLVANPTNDLIIVRRSAAVPGDLEVLFNGVVTAIYEESSMYRITVNGGGGRDTFVLDTSNGELNLPSGVEFVGDGDDVVRVDSPLQTNWTIGRLPVGFEGTNQGGSGFAAVGSTLDPDCQPGIVSQVVFNLNFVGNIWNDATPWLGGTYGDAMRAAVQNYFDNVLAPTFAGNFALSITISDLALTALSTSRALGGQFINIAGQQIFASSPFSILTGRGDTNGASADAEIDFNVDFALYGGDNVIGRQALLDNLDGLTRYEFLKVLGMESFIPNHTTSNDPRGGRNIASVMDLGLRDLNNAPLLGNYSLLDNEFDVLNYSVNGSWAGDTSGLYFRGIGDTGLELKLPVNSNAVLIDFDAMAFTFAGTSRNGAFDQIIEQDRAFLRGLGYSLAPVVPLVPSDGNNIYFSGADVVFGSSGVDHFCITSINYDFSLNGRNGNDSFVMTAVGSGALNLSGNSGDDYYEVRVGGGSVVTVIDSVGSENDRLLGLGTANNDLFVFESTGVTINGGLLVFSGIEDVNFDGQAGDDTFSIRAGNPDVTKIVGGDGLDKFFVNRVGSNNTDTLRITKVVGTMTEQLQLNISSVITDSYRSESVEVFQVDGKFIIDDVNGVPTVAGGLQLMGDGNETVTLESSQTADWLINGNGSGTLTLNAIALAFMGIGSIDGGHQIDNFIVTMTNTGMFIRGREGSDSFVLNNSGNGIVTIEGNLGNDTFFLNKAGGGVNLSGNEGLDSFLIELAGGGQAAVSGGDGNDSFTVLNSGSTGLKMYGDAGIDTFVVANPTGTAPIEAHGGAGNDQFTVLSSGLGTLELFGELGDDTYSVSLVAPAGNIRIIDSINAENDVLTVGVGTSGDDVFTINGNFGVFAGANWEIVGIESYGFDGLAGNDTFNISMPVTFNGALVIKGGLGNDRIILNQTGAGPIQLLGGAGDDYYEVHFSPSSNVSINDTSGTDSLRGVGTAGIDQFDLTASAATVNGGVLSHVGLESVEYLGLGSNDVFNVATALGNSFFSGGSGNDVFNVALTTNGNRYAGDDGNDVFNITSTSATAEFSGGNGDDVFNVNATTGGGIFLGDAGNDLFNIGASTGLSTYRGGTGNDVFVVTDRLPKGSAGAIDIDGDSGNNQLVVNGYEAVVNTAVVTTTAITGMSAVPINYRSTGGTFSLPTGAVGGIVLNGSDSIGDTFIVNSFASSNSLRLLGRGGDDVFTLPEGALGTIQAEGGEGTDLYQFAVGTNQSRRLSIVDTGLTGTDRLVVTATLGNDDLILFGQSFTIKTDRVTIDQNLESMIVDMRSGDDFVSIGRMNVGFLRILLGAGMDRINVGDFTGIPSGVSVDGGTEQDIFSFANSASGSFAQVYGGTGNDLFFVAPSALGTVRLDGQDGSDNYDISLAAAGTVRTTSVFDTGTTFTDVDRIQINGTNQADSLNLRTNLVSTATQRVIYDNKVETLVVRTGAGVDNLAVYGISARNTNLLTENDQDVVTVHSTFGSGISRNVNIDLGAGDDVATVRYLNADSVVSIAGGTGNDLINLGSTQAQNNGVLEFIAGKLSLVGNEGSDRVYVNDVGTTGTKNYRVNGNSLAQFSASNVPFPGSIFYGGMESLRLDGTNFANRVNVTSSRDTTFEFFGKGGGNQILLDPIDAAIDGRVLTLTSATSGRWTFTNGKRDVFFADFTVL